MRSVAAVVIGFILWSVLWLTYNVALQKAGVLPSDVSKPVADAKALLLLLFGSVCISAIAGYVAASVAKSASIVPAVTLGLLLLAAGVFFQAQYWRLMPVWYHLSFLALLLPLCLIGARLHTT
jgi:ABC-type multidrug transport system permease subunit